MSSKPKKVTYKDPADDNADYLVPLQYDPNLPLPSRTKSSKKESPPNGIFASIYFLISIILYAGVPISQFIIGLIYIGQCTIRQFVSIYMILSGIFGIAFVIVGLVIHMQTRKQSSSFDDPKSNSIILKILKPIFILLFLFVIAWFITGQVIVFEIKLSVEFFDPVLPEYCHGNLYKAAYILIFVDYLIFLIAIILIILTCVSPPDSSNTNKKKRPVRSTRK